VGLFVLLGTFLTVTAGVVAGFYALSGVLFRDATRIRRRVEDEFARGATDPAPRSPLFKNPSRFDLDLPATPEDAAAAPPARGPFGLRSRLESLLAEANVSLTLRQLLFLAGGLGLLLGVAGTLAAGPWVGLPAAAAGAALPLVYLQWRRHARREKLLAQLPGAFDLMARVIRTGQSVPQALQAVADSFDEPIAGEFAACQKRQNLGLRPEVTFREMAERTGILEMRLFVMAMLIQRQAGGNLSEVLERLAGLLRERHRLRKQVRTLTTEGRLQGWTLAVLPFLMFGALLVLNRSYALILFDHVPLLVGTGVLMALGLLWVRKIVNFDI
jgi:tight adherence protein B